MCEKSRIHAGYWFFEKLHGSIEDEFPVGTFWDG